MSKTRTILVGGIHSRLVGLTVKNILINYRCGILFLWISFDDACNHLNNNFMDQIRVLLRQVKEHAKLYWTTDDSTVEQIQVT